MCNSFVFRLYVELTNQWFSAISAKHNLHLCGENSVLKFGRGCEIMEFQQNLYLITRIVKQIVRLQYIKFVGKIIIILNIKG